MINGVKMLAAFLILFVTLPIWFYLLYHILMAINANEGLFFLFWIYVPSQFLATAIARSTEES